MMFPDRLQAALTRLSASLHQLEAAAERRTQADAVRADYEEEFRVLQDDRARLAVELDGALARGSALLAANGEVAVRLDRAGATVQALLVHLDSDEGDAPSPAQRRDAPSSAQPE